MLPYFLKLDQPIISDQLSIKIADWCLNNQHQFVKHVTEQGFNDGNNYFSAPGLYTLEEIKRLKELCSVAFTISLYLHEPNARVVKHYDNPKLRKSSLIQPLYPKQGYIPTDFWANMTDTIPAATFDFNDQLPAIVNIGLIHSLTNADTPRINLQLSFQEDFETVVGLHQEHRLFIVHP